MFDVSFTISAQLNVNRKGLCQRKSFIKFFNVDGIDINEFSVRTAIDINDLLPQQLRHQFSDNIICNLHLSATILSFAFFTRVQIRKWDCRLRLMYNKFIADRTVAKRRNTTSSFATRQRTEFNFCRLRNYDSHDFSLIAKLSDFLPQL